MEKKNSREGEESKIKNENEGQFRKKSLEKVLDLYVPVSRLF